MWTSISLHVGTCDVSSSLSWFLFQVSLKFSPATAVPAEDIVLTVSAQAGSLCGLSAIDQSVLIMESGRSLTPKRVSVCYLFDSYCTDVDGSIGQTWAIKASFRISIQICDSPNGISFGLNEACCNVLNHAFNSTLQHIKDCFMVPGVWLAPETIRLPKRCWGWTWVSTLSTPSR